MYEIKAPAPLKCSGASAPLSWSDGRSIFLAGSIEMGKAENWQEEVVRELKNEPVIILNPRRDDWDSSWEQKIDNPQFREQVEWELDAMGKANLIAMYFDPDTKSPITLLELGLFHEKTPSRKMVVYCPEGYWRKGNVDIVCRRFNIMSCVSWNDFILTIKREYR